jgi:RNA chaperone Hfq
VLIDTQNSAHDMFLETIYNKKSPIKIYLKSGIALQGFIEAFGQTVIILRNQENQLIYKTLL